ncbi:hypothetical protein QOZ96_000045 [Brevundimonas nasdae]|uniref:DUF3800 domain-containing protein n=1 Tax=Brevundimonas nasdae TaxID=172043 RepID=UPI001914A6AC|nr:DUF3800 domain-containing protein [Brevundimonas nasdae]MBK6023471.1 DUF3800 domain-containing protein [Brevundimonas nasdae]MDQ0450120.1 hypothetical protein [Brevundimonas nasdae]
MTQSDHAPSRYFLDESGTTGDLSKAGAGLDFKQQPVFALAAVGVDDEQGLADRLAQIRRCRFSQAAELKSSKGHATSAVVSELLDAIDALGGGILLEVMDKRFTLGATMINTLVMRPLSPDDHNPSALWFRAQLAEQLHDTAPVEVYDAFIQACRNPGEASLKAAFRAVLQWAPPETPRDSPAGAIRFFTLDSLKDYRKAGVSKPEVQRQFLPLPDSGHTGKEVWVLPHLSAFTNLYARINKLRGGSLAEVQIVHDDQPYVAEILRSSKQAVEGLAADDRRVALARADYRFVETCELTFTASTGSPGVQAADLIAGFAMRYTRDALAGTLPSPESLKVFRRLANTRDGTPGFGMNLMLSNRDVLRCGLLPSRDPAVRPSAPR